MTLAFCRETTSWRSIHRLVNITTECSIVLQGKSNCSTKPRLPIQHQSIKIAEFATHEASNCLTRRFANRNQRCKTNRVAFSSFPGGLFCSEEALQKKNSSQHWDFEGSLEGEYVESSPMRKHRGARRRTEAGAETKGEKERRRNPPRRWSAGFVRGPHGVPSSYDRIRLHESTYTHQMDTEYAAKLRSPTWYNLGLSNNSPTRMHQR